MAAKRKRRTVKRTVSKRKRANPKAKRSSVKMRRAPKGWIKAKAVRVVRRGGKRIVEVKR